MKKEYECKCPKCEAEFKVFVSVNDDCDQESVQIRCVKCGETFGLGLDRDDK